LDFYREVLMRDQEALEYRRQKKKVLYRPANQGGKGEEVTIIHASIGTGTSVKIQFSDGRTAWISASEIHDVRRVW